MKLLINEPNAATICNGMYKTKTTSDIGHKFQRSVAVWGHLDEFGEVKVKFERKPESEEYDAYLLEFIPLDDISDIRTDLSNALNGDYDTEEPLIKLGNIYNVNGEVI